MSPFESFVGSLVAIGVVVAAISNYLIINKLWKRKHMRDVAESISISAAFLGLATSIPLLVQLAVIDQTPLPALKTVIGIVTGIIFVFIGSGLWVRENRHLSFGRLLLRALRLEKEESTDLLKAMVQPRGADQILRILELVAKLDQEVHEKELALLDEFAERWKIPATDLAQGRVFDDGNLLRVREEVERYLDLKPPHEQAAQLLDVLNLFVKADREVSHEEKIVLEEISGIISEYVGGDSVARPTFDVVIVPQSAEQFEAVEELIPGAGISRRRGGKVVSVGTFFSHDYAEAVCQKYIALGLFTAQVAS